MRKLLRSSNSVILIVAFVAIFGLLMPIAEAEITPAEGITVHIYYAKPSELSNDNENINSFDFFRNRLFFTTGKYEIEPGNPPIPNYYTGFKVYKVLGRGRSLPKIIYSDDDVYGFSGGRIKRYGDCMLFNDGGTASLARMSFDYYVFDPRAKPLVVNKLYDSNQHPKFNLWGLSTRLGSDLWAAGTPDLLSGGMYDNQIFYSSLDFDDDDHHNHCCIDYSNGNPPIISIGDVDAGGSGPLVFDSHGNLYYAQGFNGQIFPDFQPIDSFIYRFSAAEVADAIDDPVKDRLKITGSNEWETIIAMDGTDTFGLVLGVSSMVFVEDIGLVLSATFGIGPSQLRLYTINPDDSSGGYTVLATSSGRMSEIRYRFGKIYFNDPDGIYCINVTQLLDDDEDEDED
jgi:hypothetical protein